MTRATIGLCVLLALCGCPAGGDDGAAGSGGRWECEAPAGSWQFEYEEQDGDCGPMPDEIVKFGSGGDGPTIVDPDCDMQTEGGFCDPDGAYGQQACTIEVPGIGTGLREITTVVRRTGPDTIEGSLILRIIASGAVCTSSYDVAATPL